MIDRARDLAGKKNKRVPEVVAYRVNQYLLDIAKILRLADWMIIVNDDPPEDDEVTACINSRRGQKFAGVWLSDRFLDPNDESLNDLLRSQTLIHELIHLHFEEAWHFVEDSFFRFMPSETRYLADHVHKQQMEVAIDQLAYVLVDFFPQFSLLSSDLASEPSER